MEYWMGFWTGVLAMIVGAYMVANGAGNRWR